MRLVRSRSCRTLLAAAGALLVLGLPASASALDLHIVNESGRPANEVFVDIAGGNFGVPGFVDDQPKALSEIPGGKVTIETLDSGRVYVSYGAPVTEGVPFNSPTRFDWAELTVTPASTDVANLTAVDQFAIGMRLTTFGAAGEAIESVGSTYANTMFGALQQVPGGPAATVRNANGEIVRVLSPLHSLAYPLLSEYVHSMAGQRITLHTPFFGEPFVTSEYSGIFGADGSINLTGTMNAGAGDVTAPSIEMNGPELIEDVYTGAHTPNTLEGAVRRDVLSGFSIGLWGGKYGNDARAFCTNLNTTSQGIWCPDGFDVPAFAEARTVAPPFPAYEQYAAAIDQYADIYGNPYSDASKKVTVALDQPRVTTLQLSILPDSPPASSDTTSPGSGSAPATPTATAIPPTRAPAPAPASTPGSKAAPPRSQVNFKLAKKARLKRGKLVIGRVACKGACGRIVTLLKPKRGKGVIAREAVKTRAHKRTLILKPTKLGRSALRRGRVVSAKLTVTVTQPARLPARKRVRLRVLR
jgi:hypothetical protein